MCLQSATLSVNSLVCLLSTLHSVPSLMASLENVGGWCPHWSASWTLYPSKMQP